MKSTNPLLEDLKGILQQIAANAAQAEKERKVPAENIKLLKSIGMHRALQRARLSSSVGRNVIRPGLYPIGAPPQYAKPPHRSQLRPPPTTALPIWDTARRRNRLSVAASIP